MQNETCFSEQRVLPEEFSRRLFYTSQLSGISVLLSLYYGQYDFAAFAVLVLFNSINYWRYPVRGLRRNVDILCAAAACLYQMQASFGLGSQLYFTAYWVTALAGVFSYHMARRSDQLQGDVDAASRWHMGLHVFGNVSNAFLYHGFSLQ